jgi:hypothetical protein
MEQNHQVLSEISNYHNELQLTFTPITQEENTYMTIPSNDIDKENGGHD